MQIHVKIGFCNKYFELIYTDNNYELKPELQYISLETCNLKMKLNWRSQRQRSYVVLTYKLQK
jgi:hypothetical protein